MPRLVGNIVNYRTFRIFNQPSYTMAKKTKKRKKTSTTVAHPSPLKYIKSQSRSLPVYQCHITENWAKMGLATAIVARQQPSGNFVVGTYLVDTFCLGVKDT